MIYDQRLRRLQHDYVDGDFKVSRRSRERAASAAPGGGARGGEHAEWDLGDEEDAEDGTLEAGGDGGGEAAGGGAESHSGGQSRGPPWRPRGEAEEHALALRAQKKDMIRANRKRGDILRQRAQVGQLVRQLHRGGVSGVRSYNTTLSGLVAIGRLGRARQLMRDMEQRGLAADRATYDVMLRLCARTGDVAGAGRVMRAMRRHGVRPDERHYMALLSVLVRRRDKAAAFAFFERMPSLGVTPDRRHYVHLLGVCDGEAEARSVWARMLEVHTLAPNYTAYNALVSACARGGDAAAAQRAVDQMRGDGLEPDVVTLTAVVTAYLRAGDWDGCVAAFRNMYESGIEPDAVAYATIVKAAELHAQEPGDPFVRFAEEVFEEANCRGKATGQHLWTNLMSVYAKAGCAAEARRLWQRAADAGIPRSKPFLSHFDAATGFDAGLPVDSARGGAAVVSASELRHAGEQAAGGEEGAEPALAEPPGGALAEWALQGGGRGAAGSQRRRR